MGNYPATTAEETWIKECSKSNSLAQARETLKQAKAALDISWNAFTAIISMQIEPGSDEYNKIHDRLMGDSHHFCGALNNYRHAFNRDKEARKNAKDAEQD